MELLKRSAFLGSLLSGILAFFAVGQINFFVSWIFFIPLFISLTGSTSGSYFKKGFLFGLVLAFVGFYWMIPGAERFTGRSVFYGIAVFFLSIIFFALYNGLVFFLFSQVKQSGDHRFAVFNNAIIVSACLVAGESLMMFVSRGFPWFDLHSGSGLAANIYSIQPASVFGVHILSFITVVVNYLAAAFIAEKKYKQLYIPAAVLCSYLFCGFLLLKVFKTEKGGLKPFKLAIVAENIMPDIKWDDTNGNMMVNNLLQLNKSATSNKPGLILWSESAIPWTYRKDDDLVNEILKTTNPAGITHILGINTEITSNEVYNSAYAILPGGNVAGRYDKQYLLALIEQPLNGLIMPFFSSKGFIARNDQAHSAPLPTSYGKAGIFICNEAAVPEAAADKCKRGANFLCNMSNDGWFNDTYIVNLHFFYDRLRAVESRKDLAINCNNGYSGLIKASGEIAEMQRSNESFVQVLTIEPGNNLTLASMQPRLFAYACLIFVLLAFGFRKIKEYRSPAKQDKKM